MDTKGLRRTPQLEEKRLSLYTYIVARDSGLAPNPFWGWCTLAVCTPNHQSAKAQEGSWIAGFLGKKCGHKFLYAMEVCERIQMDRYFKDPRFRKKKPRVRGSWMERCGDNFYSLDDQGCWQQHATLFHKGSTWISKDTKNPTVFIAKRFWYLGEEAVPIPDHFKALIGARGIRVNHPPALVNEFKNWVQLSFSQGVTYSVPHLVWTIDKR